MNLANSSRLHGKARLDVPLFVYTFLCISNSGGFGIAYPRTTGNARAYMSGISDSFDSRAFSIMLVIVWNIVITIKTDKNEKTINNYDVLARDDGGKPEC